MPTEENSPQQLKARQSLRAASSKLEKEINEGREPLVLRKEMKKDIDKMLRKSLLDLNDSLACLIKYMKLMAKSLNKKQPKK